MTTDPPTFQIFFALIEKRGERTDFLINEIILLSKRFNIYEEITLANVLPATNSGPTDNKLVYSIDVPVANSVKSSNIVGFLTHIFEKKFDKFPAFTEPDYI